MATVVDAGGRLVGVNTDGDLRRLQLAGGPTPDARAGEVATRTPKTIAAEELAAKAIDVMEAWAITSLVVVDDDCRPVGVIHMHDILRAKIL
jgi:arabinose-5-phosphate isomerase